MRKIVIILIVVVGAISILFLLFRPPSQTTSNNSLVIKGSDTEVQLVSNLAEKFGNENSGVKLSVTGGGSGVGIAALLNNDTDIADSSRKMTDAEIKQASAKNKNIYEFILAIDGISIITNRENPIKSLSLDQLKQIYTSKITNWQEVGGTNHKITLYGRQTTSGTYTFFQDYVVRDDYSPQMRNMEGNQAIVDAVKVDKDGIGYVGVGYIKDANDLPRTDISIVPVSKDQSSQAISPLDKEAVKNDIYPIARPIYQYFTQVPVKDSLLEKFLHFEVSEAGQTIVEKAGFYSLTNKYIMQNQHLFDTIKE